MLKKTLHRACALFIAVMMAASLLSVSALAADTSTYRDVSPDASYAKAVTYLHDNGYMIGTGAREFSPDATLTRGMAVTVLYRLAGEPAISGSASFPDLKAGQYYSDAILWAVENGILEGDPDGAVRPDSAITVTEANTIISRYAANIVGKTVAGSLSEPVSTSGGIGGIGGGIGGDIGGGIGGIGGGIGGDIGGGIGGIGGIGGGIGGIGGGIGGDIGGGIGGIGGAQEEQAPATVSRADFAVAVLNLINSTIDHDLDISAHTGDWTYMAPNSFEIQSSNRGNPISTGLYNETGIYALKDIVYVSNPTISGGEPVQVMNIFVPAEYMKQNADGTCVIDPDGTKTVTYYDETGAETGTYTWTAETAPIIFVNTVDGYAGSSVFEVTGSKAGLFYYSYIEKGFILVGVTSRGLGSMMDGGAATTNDEGLIVGKAPSGLIDLKAAVAYLKYNDEALAGSSERIFTQGGSAGGAMSALLGATGDAPEYDSYLAEIGAADASNSVYGSQVYCPLTDLDHGDAAYEWLHMYQYYSTISGAFDEYQIALHEALIDIYIDYLQGLGLDIGDDGVSGTYYTNLMQEAVDALNHAVAIGNNSGVQKTVEEVYEELLADLSVGMGPDASTMPSPLATYLEENNLSIEDVITWNEEKQTFELESFKVFDLSNGFTRKKTVPAFSDDFSTEIGLFAPNGVTEDGKVRFSLTYLQALEVLKESDDQEIAARAQADYDKYAGEIQSVIDSGVTNLMNPMYYLGGEGYGTSTIAPYWRLNNGTADSDAGSIAAWTIYNQLQQLGISSEFNLIYGAPHGSADYMRANGNPNYTVAEALLTWIAQAAAGDLAE